MITKEQGKQILERNWPLAQKIQSNIRALNEFRKIYNLLCEACMKRVLAKPDMGLKSYCPECQKKIEFRIVRIKRLLGR